MTSDAVIAIDAATGTIRWSNQRTADDTFTTAFHPSTEHPDFDFGDSPNLMHLRDGRTVIAAGQKSGVMYVLDARTGELLSLKQFLPSGGYGGLFADSASSGNLLIANGNDWPDFGGGEFGAVIGALTGERPPKSGQVIAMRPDRAGVMKEQWRFVTPGQPMMVGVAYAHQVVYARGSRDGVLSALSSRTGRPLAKVDIGPGVSGPSVAHGRVFAGYGDVVNIATTNPASGGVVALAP